MKESKSVWTLEYNNFKPAQEGLREALCTLGNGYLGTRGAVTESGASRIHYPGTYIAGVYNKLATHIAGQTIWNEDLVNCPNWLFLNIRIGDGEWISPVASKILFYQQQLDMRRGVLNRCMRLEDRKGHITKIDTQRIVSMADPHRAVIRYCITPENYDDWVIIRSFLDGTVQNMGVARYRQLSSRHLKAQYLGSFSKNGIFLSMRTNQSDIRISLAAKLRIFAGDKELRPAGRFMTKEKKRGVGQEFAIRVEKKKAYCIEKNVSIFTSKDKGVRNSLTAAISSVKSAPVYDVILSNHRHVWEALWKRFDIKVTGDAFSQQALRLHTFHLLQTASIHNIVIDASIPARGLHGEAYRGHIFWDELFVMPFFDLHAPEISKSLMIYRYKRLSPARRCALENGYRGSMFPWQSSLTGEEETQIIHLNPISGKWGSDNSRIQRHVSFAVAYNVWQHWKMSADTDFLVNYAAEILLSIAQFGSSLVKYDSQDKKYHTEGIMGPDEFHEKLPGTSEAGFRDNAYTNLLIVWTILRAQETLSLLPDASKEQLLKKLEINQEELARWDDITKKMNIIVSKDGIISQFDGYFQLKELNWDNYRRKYGNIQRLDRILKAEGKSPNDYKIAKQADVLMIFYLLSPSEVKELFHRMGYGFNRNTLEKNYDYYVKRTSHGSTLSKVVHCYVAHLIGRTKESWQWYQEVLKSDIYDTQGGTTPEGIHTGVMGGSLNILIKAFAGIELLKDRVRINPKLPKAWTKLVFGFRYHGVWFALEITKEYFTIQAKGPRSKSATLPIEVKGKMHLLNFGKQYKIDI